ncbi:tryptophan synthase subunit alpha [Streptomyces narbonensis]|uniref:Tryptophan synthase alpha chain n=1 Tax=Streptomyces narbonensis TaxID=67333 RepID=A0ABV3CDP0_9ACTN
MTQALAHARRRGRAALAAYLPAGYPTFAQSLDTLHLLATTADVLEIGLPYTDPLMDGPVIQHAAEQALRAGFRTEHLFTIVRELAAASRTALVVMTYWQPVHHFGPRRFAQRLAAAGGTGVIIPDLPVDEATEWLDAAHEHHLDTVFVVAPNATDQRLARVCAAASGMVYAPATTGVTGAQGPLHPDLPAFVNRLRTLTHLPVGVGIGVSTPAQAALVGTYADAVIVGSAFIRAIDSAPGPAGPLQAALLAQRLADGLASRPAAA